MKTSDEVRSFTVEADDDGIRVDRWFKRHLPQVGFGTVSKWARTGQVRVDGKRVKPDDRLAEGVYRWADGAEYDGELDEALRPHGRGGGRPATDGTAAQRCS